MKVTAINGSPHKEGNTYHALKVVGNALEANGIEFEILHIGNKIIQGCRACGTCSKNKDEECGIKNDPVNEGIQKMKDSDGIILASPVHYSGIGGTMKSFCDRAFYVAGSNGGLFRNKIGASVTAVRRTGGSMTFAALNQYLMYSEMIIPSSNYWNVIHGRLPEEVLQDAEGVQILEILGNRMAWLIKSLTATKETLPPPAPARKVMTNFVR